MNRTEEEKRLEEEREAMIKEVNGQLKKLSMSNIYVLMKNKKEEALLKLAKEIDYKKLEKFLNTPGNRLIMPLAEISGYEIEMVFFIWATRVGMTKYVRDVEFVQNLPKFNEILTIKYEEVGQNIAFCSKYCQLTDYTIDELINGRLRKRK